MYENSVNFRFWTIVLFLILSLCFAVPFESYASVSIATASNAFYGSVSSDDEFLSKIESYINDLEMISEWESMQDETSGLDNTALYQIRDILTDIRTCVFFLATVPPAVWLVWIMIRPILFFIG
ncbi:MAG: hypothetical protein LIP16_03310 [Clostridium sp.]|nr:hypothetical protein [Clostridium sp.]